MEDDVFVDAGFSRNEAKAYKTLLRLGSSTAGSIAARANVHRTNIYDALDRLLEKGIVTYIYKGNKKYFEAVDPKQIIEVLRDRERRFQTILPSLLLDYKLSREKNIAHIFEGIKGIKTITDDMLKDGKEIFAFGIPKDVSERLKSFIDMFHKRRINQKIKMYHLYDANAKDRMKFLNSQPYTEARYIPHDIESPATTLIYGEKVAFNIWSDPPLGILIESKRMADQYKTYFKFLYKTARRS